MKVISFLNWLSLTILLSWRGPWCIKWCQCHKAELDLQGDEAALHMCNDRTKGTTPHSWALKICFLNSSLLSHGQRKLFMLEENELTTLNVSVRLLFLHHTYLATHVMPQWEAARKELLPEIVLKSHYNSKSQRQHGCVTSATCGLERVSGHSGCSRHLISTHLIYLPVTCLLQETVSLMRDKAMGLFDNPSCNALSARRSRDRKVSIIMKNVIKVLLRLNQLHLSQVPGIDFSLNPRDM